MLDVRVESLFILFVFGVVMDIGFLTYMGRDVEQLAARLHSTKYTAPSFLSLICLRLRYFHILFHK